MADEKFPLFDIAGCAKALADRIDAEALDHALTRLENRPIHWKAEEFARSGKFSLRLPERFVITKGR